MPPPPPPSASFFPLPTRSAPRLLLPAPAPPTCASSPLWKASCASIAVTCTLRCLSRSADRASTCGVAEGSVRGQGRGGEDGLMRARRGVGSVAGKGAKCFSDIDSPCGALMLVLIARTTHPCLKNRNESPPQHMRRVVAYWVDSARSALPHPAFSCASFHDKHVHPSDKPLVNIPVAPAPAAPPCLRPEPPGCSAATSRRPPTAPQRQR